jgi:ectoine hydroxylase-related dioxygenase (phytanoyl-CoA dioxygenase family)
MSEHLTPEQVAFFEENGYLILPRLFSDEELEALRRRAEWIASGEAPHIPAEYRQVEPRIAQGEQSADSYVLSLRKLSHMAWYDEVMLAHARDPRVTDKVVSLLGPDIKLYQDQLFMKPPRVGSRQRYHQDQPLGFHIDPPEPMVTCWLALDDATLENGCLRVLPGTHRRGVLSEDALAEIERRAVAGDLPEEVPLAMRAGQCSLHHGHLLHSSFPNLSDQRRRGYATHYVSAHCRYTGPEPKPEFPLVRGEAAPGCL